jgi:hypothetical protein
MVAFINPIDLVYNIAGVMGHFLNAKTGSAPRFTRFLLFGMAL